MHIATKNKFRLIDIKSVSVDVKSNPPYVKYNSFAVNICIDDVK